MHSFDKAFQELPLVAILRGIQTHQVNDVMQALIEAGVGLAEITLNSPDAALSLQQAIENFGDKILLGAGTVTCMADATKLQPIGAQFIVSPNCDSQVIEYCLSQKMTPVPGVFSPTEAFTAIRAGARYLKCFPVASLATDYVKHLKTVVPNDCQLLAVGGVNENNLVDYWRAGATGFGIGSDIYQAGDRALTVLNKAKNWVNRINSLANH